MIAYFKVALLGEKNATPVTSRIYGLADAKVMLGQLVREYPGRTLIIKAYTSSGNVVRGFYHGGRGRLMKPSPAAPWTLEDAMVWRRFELTIGDLAVWRYVHADRRDSDLMYKRERAKADTRENWEHWATHRREWFPSAWGFPTNEHFNPT